MSTIIRVSDLSVNVSAADTNGGELRVLRVSQTLGSEDKQYNYFGELTSYPTTNPANGGALAAGDYFLHSGVVPPQLAYYTGSAWALPHDDATTATDAATTATDAATTATDAATTATDAATTATDAATTATEAATEAEGYRDETEGYRDETEGYRDETEGYRDATVAASISLLGGLDGDILVKDTNDGLTTKWGSILGPLNTYVRRNNGTTDYATIPEVTLAGDFVIEFDIYRDSSAGSAGQFPFASYDNAGSAYGLSVYTTGDWIGGEGFISLYGFTTGTSAITGMASNTFYKIKYAYLEGVLKSYLNGVLVNTAASTPPTGIGVATASSICRAAQGGFNFSGILANLRIWDDGTLIRDYPINDDSDILANKATVLGPELWENPNLVGGASYDAGVLSISTTGNKAGGEVFVPAGTHAIMSFDVELTEGELELSVLANLAGTVAGSNISSSGRYTFLIDSSDTIGIKRVFGVGSVVATVSNISVNRTALGPELWGDNDLSAVNQGVVTPTTDGWNIQSPIGNSGNWASGGADQSVAGVTPGETYKFSVTSSEPVNLAVFNSSFSLIATGINEVIFTSVEGVRIYVCPRSTNTVSVTAPSIRQADGYGSVINGVEADWIDILGNILNSPVPDDNTTESNFLQTLADNAHILPRTDGIRIMPNVNDTNQVELYASSGTLLLENKQGNREERIMLFDGVEGDNSQAGFAVETSLDGGTNWTEVFKVTPDELSHNGVDLPVAMPPDELDEGTSTTSRTVSAEQLASLRTNVLKDWTTVTGPSIPSTELTSGLTLPSLDGVSVEYDIVGDSGATGRQGKFLLTDSGGISHSSNYSVATSSTLSSTDNLANSTVAVLDYLGYTSSSDVVVSASGEVSFRRAPDQGMGVVYSAIGKTEGVTVGESQAVAVSSTHLSSFKNHNRDSTKLFFEDASTKISHLRYRLVGTASAAILLTRFFRRNEGTTDHAKIPEVTLEGDYSIVVDCYLDELYNWNTVIDSSTNANFDEYWIYEDGSVACRPTGGSEAGNIRSAAGVVPEREFFTLTFRRVSTTTEILINNTVVASGEGVVSTIAFDGLYGRNNTKLRGILANLRVWDDGTLIRDYPLDDNADILVNKATSLGSDHGTSNQPIPLNHPYQQGSVTIGEQYLIVVTGLSLDADFRVMGGGWVNLTDGVPILITATTQAFLFQEFWEEQAGVNISIHRADGYGTVINGNSGDWASFTQQSTGEWLGQELITQAIWENPFSNGAQWSFADDLWSLVGDGDISALQLLQSSIYPGTVRLVVDCVSISGGSGLTTVVSNSDASNTINSTGLHTVEISKAMSGSHQFKRLAGAVSASIRKPSIREVLNTA